MLRSMAPSVRAPRPGRVLVVDDNRRAASTMAQWLCGLGWHATAAGSADEALPLLTRDRFDAAIVDGSLPGDGARRIAARTRSNAAGTALVFMLPQSAAPPTLPLDADAVVDAPPRDADLLAALARAAETAARRAAQDACPLLGESSAMREIHALTARLADAPATVLITGESGTGKSLLARRLHGVSRRREGRFVEVACGCLSETLLESELFGHVAGAFTGATADREGKFLQADGGTIFLDEIATASPSLQVKLLRVLQERRFEAVGGAQTRAVDVRVILATNEDLAALVAAGRFRADLFWRVNVITIEMPPLRERTADIPLLAAHFLAAAEAHGGRAMQGFTPEATEALLRHRWPGNVRELSHAVEHAVFLGSDSLVGLGDLPPAIRGAAPVRRGGDGDESATPSLKRALEHPERRLILEALERHGWRRDAAARALGINRTTLYKKLRRLGIGLEELERSR